MADDEWRFAVEDVGDDQESPENGSDGERTDLDAGDASEAPGERDERPPLEPGSPSLENALFVLLGVFVTLFVIARVVVLAVG